jgi:hypothetical protein
MADTTTQEPPTPAAPAVELWYCSRCGRVETFLTDVIAKRKESKNCPVDTRPLKPLAGYSTDPELGL